MYDSLYFKLLMSMLIWREKFAKYLMLNKLWLNKLEQEKFLKLQSQHFQAMSLSIFKNL